MLPCHKVFGLLERALSRAVNRSSVRAYQRCRALELTAGGVDATEAVYAMATNSVVAGSEADRADTRRSRAAAKSINARSNRPNRYCAMPTTASESTSAGIC